MRRYGFVKPHLTLLFSIIDALGYRLLPPRRVVMKRVERVLLMNLAHIGDVLMTTPAIEAVRQAYPKAHLAFLAGPWSADLLKSNPFIDNLIIYPASWWDRSLSQRWGLGYYLRLLHECSCGPLVHLLREGRFDLSVNFKSFFQENLAVFAARIPCRLGYGIYGGGFLLTHCISFPWHLHNVERNQELLWGSGVMPRQPHARPTVHLTVEDRQAAEAFLSQQGVKVSSHPLMALHVGAGYPSKRWPLERYTILAEELIRSKGARIILVGGREDLPHIEAMQPHLEGSLIAAGQLSITQTAALLARCQLFVGNDSAPAHLAVAVGTPSVVLFSGENDARIWRPYGERCIVIQKFPPCYPCGKARCPYDHSCMREITVEEVLEAVESLAGAPGPVPT